MARVVAVCQARVSSVRLPAKVLTEVAGRPLISHVLSRIATAETIDHLLLATGDAPANAPLVALCQGEGWDYFVGSEHNVLERLHQAARYAGADAIVRITGDCPLHDGAEVDRVVRFATEHHYQYASNCHPPRLPDGLDTEVMTIQTLAWLASEASTASDREHTTPMVRRRLSRFWWGSVGHTPDLSRYRLTVDTPADLAAIRALMDIGGPDLTWQEALRLLDEHPEIRALNDGMARNEGLVRSLQAEKGAML